MSNREDFGAAALVARRDELRRIITPSDRQWPWLLAGSVQAADDLWAQKRQDVSVADGIGWMQIDAVFDLALYGFLAHRGIGHGSSLVGPDCRWCLTGDQFHQTSLVDPIIRRRSVEYVALYNATRSALREQLAQFRSSVIAGS